MNARAGDRIVTLPTQWLGYSFHHMRFGGSLTARSQTHIRMLVETVDGLIRAGFDKVLIVNGHGGNGADMKVALQDLKESPPRRTRLRRLLVGSFGAAAGRPARSGTRRVRHSRRNRNLDDAGPAPDLVRTDRLHRDGGKPPSPYTGSVDGFAESTSTAAAETSAIPPSGPRKRGADARCRGRLSGGNRRRHSEWNPLTRRPSSAHCCIDRTLLERSRFRASSLCRHHAAGDARGQPPGGPVTPGRRTAWPGTSSAGPPPCPPPRRGRSFPARSPPGRQNPRSGGRTPRR